MSPGGEIRTEHQARALLKLGPADPPSTWRAAFQREVKAAHPDRGGDSERVRLVIEAYRFLKTHELSGQKTPPPGPRPHDPSHARSHAQARPNPQPRPQPHPARPEPPPQGQAGAQARAQAEPPRPRKEAPLRISIVEAFRGAERLVSKDGRRFKVRLPSGLQTGDVVRFGEGGQWRLTIEVEMLPKAVLKGSDLWLTVGVSREFLKEGGRVELDTPLGPRKFWVSRTSATRGLYRVPNEGLPPRGSRERGHLFLKFEADDSLNERPAKSLLARFAQVWAAE